MHFSYYILAAGHGRRAGGPKAWRLHEGRPLLAHHVDFLSRRVSPEHIAISIQADWLPRCHALNPHIHWLAVDPDASPLSSLQRLTREMPLVQWSFVYHVDMPLWLDVVFDALQHATQQVGHGIEAFIPQFGERGGHPVLLSPVLAASLAALDAGVDRLDHWLRRVQTQRVPVEDASILENWNEPGESPGT